MRDLRPAETLIVYYEEDTHSFTISVEINGKREHFILKRPSIDFNNLILKKHIEELAKKLAYLDISADDIEVAIMEECKLKDLSLKCLW